MKNFFHLFSYLFFRQLSWVVGYWCLAAAFVIVVAYSSLFVSQFIAALLLGALAMIALVIVIQVHDHLDREKGEGVLTSRPISRKNLLVAELGFLFTVLILPVIVGTLITLGSYDAKDTSYLVALILWGLLTSQLVLWYVAGALSKSSFRTILLILAYYIPVFLVWAIVEYANDHQAFDFTILLVLVVTGLLSLVLLFLKFQSWRKKTLFIGSAGAFLLAMSWVNGSPNHVNHWTVDDGLNGRMSGDFPGPGESLSVKFAIAPTSDADPMKDSHWYYFQFSNDRLNEAFIPTALLGGESLKNRSKSYTYYRSYPDYSWKRMNENLFGDVILRNFPEGTDLRASEPTLRFHMSGDVPEGPEMISVLEDETATLHGQKFHLTKIGGIPLKVGARETQDGYRVCIKMVSPLANKLAITIEIGRVFDTLARMHRVRERSMWVLYSPSLKRGVVTNDWDSDIRGGVNPLLVAKRRVDLDFPLPPNFVEVDDLELHGFLIDEGKHLKFEVPIPAGEYSLR